jgi:hypothetical protein
MDLKSQAILGITHDLVEAIRTFPAEREVEHCGDRFKASPFEFYAECPRCGARIKLRSFSGGAELEDLFDAVFEWMSRPTAAAAAERRRAILGNDEIDVVG